MANVRFLKIKEDERSIKNRLAAASAEASTSDGPEKSSDPRDAVGSPLLYMRTPGFLTDGVYLGDFTRE